MNRRIRIHSAILAPPSSFLAIVLIATTANADIFRVRPSQWPVTDVDEWNQDTFSSIGAAVDQAKLLPGPHEIWVAGKADGVGLVYKVPVTQTTPAKAVPFLLDGNLPGGSLRGIRIAGGYAGGINGIDNERNAAVYKTIITGDALSTDVEQDLDWDWDHFSRDDNAAHVFVIRNFEPGDGIRIVGFTIRGGNADGNNTAGELANSADGGALNITNAAVRVIDCTIEDNSAGRTPEVNAQGIEVDEGAFGRGGAVYVVPSDPLEISGPSPEVTFESCVFQRNVATAGGAMYIRGREFRGQLDIEGNPLCVDDDWLMSHPNASPAKVSMFNCLLHHNRTEDWGVPAPAGGAVAGMGGAVLVHFWSKLAMVHCTIADNDSEEEGGGLMVFCLREVLGEGELIQKSGVDIVASIFWNNRGDVHHDGGGTKALQQIRQQTQTLGGQCCDLGNFAVVQESAIQGANVFGGTIPAETEGNELDNRSVASSIEGNAQFVVATPAFRTLPSHYALANLPGTNGPLLDQIADPLSIQAVGLELLGFPLDGEDINSDGLAEAALQPLPDVGLRQRVLINAADYGAYETFFGSCLSDVEGFDFDVDVSDLLVVLANWGDCAVCPPQVSPLPDTCKGDVDRNCSVNVTDLLTLLAQWGPCDGGSQTPEFDAQIYDKSLQTDYGIVSDKWDMVPGRFPDPPTTMYQVAADDFRPTTSDPITQVRWWGFYDESGADCYSGYLNSFTVTYYQATVEEWTGKRIPGMAIATFTTPPSVMLMPDTLGNGLPLYMYTLSHTALNVTQGECYFIEIRNNGGDADPQGCHWHWAYSGEAEWPWSVFWLGPDGMTYEQMGDFENGHNLSFALDVQFGRYDPVGMCPQE